MRALFLVILLVSCGSDDKNDTATAGAAISEIATIEANCADAKCEVYMTPETTCESAKLTFYNPTEYEKFEAKNIPLTAGKTIVVEFTSPTPYRDDSITKQTLRYECA